MTRVSRLGQPNARPQSGVQAIQPFLARLKRNLEDVTLLVVGDSTGNATDEWIYLLTQYLATQWPTHTVSYQLWDNTGLAYGSATTVQTGTGSNTLHVYNASVPGWNCLDPLVSLPAIAGAVQPHLTLVSLGHNEADFALYNGFRSILYGRYIGLTESITAMCPTTALVCVLQNPTTINTNQALRASVYEQIAAARGYGIIDVHQAFIDAGIPAAWFLDTVHPNATGELVWAGVVQSYFQYAPGASPLPRATSSFLQPAEQMLVNGDFQFFSAATPDSWTNTGATCSKDTTNKESPNGYAVRIQSAGASAAYLYQELSAAQLASLKGKYVTLAVRLRNNAATQVSTHARIAIAIGGQASPVSFATTLTAANVFMWQVVTAYVPTGATYVRAFLYSDSSTTATGDVTVDRVVLARGSMPRDVEDPSGLSARLSTTWTPPDVQEFTATGTWTKPSGARVVHVAAIGLGGPGGSGRRGAAGTVRCGGGAGGGAAWTVMSFAAADLPSTVAVTFGAAGTPGAAVTADSTNGNAGTTGGSLTFATYLRAAGGNAGSGGTTGAGTGGAGGIGMSTGTAGGSASATGGAGTAGGSTAAGGGAGGGGSGGGITSGDAASNGGAGSACLSVAAASGASGGVVDTTAPLVGNPSPARGVPGPGAGGGASSIATAAQAGANATTYGGGGGGGGASLNGNNSGAGGTGGAGYMIVITSCGS